MSNVISLRYVINKECLRKRTRFFSRGLAQFPNCISLLDLDMTFAINFLRSFYSSFRKSSFERMSLIPRRIILRRFKFW
jgi:hypothetical protein